MAGRRGVAAGGAFLSQHHSTNEVDSAEEAAALDGAESDSLEEVRVRAPPRAFTVFRVHATVRKMKRCIDRKRGHYG